MRILLLLAGVALCAWSHPVRGAGQSGEPAANTSSLHELDDESTKFRNEPPDEASPAPKKKLGIDLESEDGRFALNVWMRGQFRFSTPFDNAPLQASDFDVEPGDEWEIRRARLKAEGHLFSPRVGFYLEHELTGDAPLLDLRLDLELGRGVLMRVGQYKVLYNRERIDSSGKQQFVERSIATYAFTLDRQIGVTAAQHWAAGTQADNWLFLGVFEGDGRGSGQRGPGPMWVARWQWQFLGRDLPFSQGEINFTDKPAASLSFGASTVRGPYTRFSSSGGGQLEGFVPGADDRYTLRQGLQELAFQYAGLSIQQELHVKRITDHDQSSHSTLVGGYLQFGKAWPFLLLGKQRAGEVAIRIAQVDWDVDFGDKVQRELTLAGNLFLRGHNHKLTADVSRVSLDEAATANRHDIRFRLQWDVSL